MKHQNLSSVLKKSVHRHSNHTFIEYRLKRSEPYKKLTWNEYYDLVTYFAHGLLGLGLRKGERVAIISDTRYEWAVADFAVLSCGGVVVPIYPTLPESQVEYLINNSLSEIVIVENKGQLQKLRSQWEKLPTVNHVIVIDDFGDLPKDEVKVLTMKEVMNDGKDSFRIYPSLLSEIEKKITRFDTATIIYTSGTTGHPKGVVLSHANILSVIEVLPDVLSLKEDDKFLSFLPLSHVFERVGCFHYAVSAGTEISYCSSIDRIGKSLTDSKSTVMCVVPRLLEKMYSKVCQNIEELPTPRKDIVKWAISLSTERIKSKKYSLKWMLLTFQWCFADKIILKKIRDNIASKMKCFISGGAPLSPEVAEFFYAIGFPVLEGYGLTETSAPATVNTMKHFKIGTVGRPLPNVEIKISNDGEILLKGPTVFKEYYKNVGATSESFDGDWFKSGDIGEIDKDGFLKITDRKKDIIIGSSGKNVAPQSLENSIKTSQFISNVCVIGNKRKFLTCLVTLDMHFVLEFCKNKGLNYDELSPVSEIIKDKVVHDLINEQIKMKTAHFADYEQIIRFTILEKDFSIQEGELTPTLKLKRKIIEHKYSDLIEKMYI